MCLSDFLIFLYFFHEGFFFFLSHSRYKKISGGILFTIECGLNNSIASLLNVLNLRSQLWLYKRIHLFLENTY